MIVQVCFEITIIHLRCSVSWIPRHSLIQPPQPPLDVNRSLHSPTLTRRHHESLRDLWCTYGLIFPIALLRLVPEFDLLRPSPELQKLSTSEPGNMVSRSYEADSESKAPRPTETVDFGTGAICTSATPAPPSERGRMADSKHNIEANSHRSTRSSIGVNEEMRGGSIDHALLREMGRPHRESTPSASPHRKRQRINGDR